MADAGDENLAVEAVVLHHLNCVGNRSHSIVGDIVDPAHEVADEGCARLGCQERLRDSEYERHVGANASVGKGLDQLDAWFNERHLDDYLLVPAVNLQRLLEHVFVVRGHDFSADRASGDELTNLEDGFLKALSALSDQGRVGGDAIQNAPISGFTYFFNVSGIDEQFHFTPSLLTRAVPVVNTGSLYLTVPQVTDTIVAPITGPGPGAVAILRISGSEAWSIAAKLFSPWRPKPFNAIYGTFLTGEDGLALPFSEGHSYTGEESVELSIHGSRAGVQALLEHCLAEGARMAEPGEFTLRAFLNGRIDLSQAEAVRDLVESDTELQLQAASGQLQGHLARSISALSDRISTLLATVEAHVDFSEEIGELDQETSLAELNQLEVALKALLKTARLGKILREGSRVAIIGPPNAGKSSLLNVLLGKQRAIVTPHPGTTRDTLEEKLNFDGLKVVVTDTAGLRESQDPVEQIGVLRAREAARDADHVWLVYDSVQGWSSELEQLLSEVGQIRTIIANKVDLPGLPVQADALRISCETGEGISELISGTREAALADSTERQVTVAPRHTAYLEAALAALQDAKSTLRHGRPSDLLSVCLTRSLHELGGITGESVEADILDRIFHDFCIGK